MQQKIEEDVKSNVSIQDLEIDRPYIKQKTEDSKESLKSALYSPVKIESPSLEITSSKGIRNRHCSICNIAFMERYIYLDHELHSHKTKETPVIDLYTLRCDICKKRYISPQRYRQHMADLNNIQIPIITPEPKSNMSITPDAKDPNNYCSSCNSTFTSQLLYSEHMIKVHHMSRLISSNIKPTIEFVTASLTFFWMIQSFLSLVFFIKNIIALLTIIF